MAPVQESPAVESLEPGQLPAAARLARYVADLAWDDVPKLVQKAVGRNVADVMGCAVAGAQTPVARAVQLTARALAGAGPDADSQRRAAGRATVYGAAERLPSASAALANSTAAHALELDDTDAQSFVHAGAVVVPAVLAVAEARGYSGRAAALAILSGYEVTLRLARWMNPTHRELGFHTTATVPTLGVAAATAKLTGGTAADIARAIAVSASFVGGTFSFLDDGASVKRVHAGKAAFCGILGAQLARNGVTGPRLALDGPHGLFATMSERGLPPMPDADPQQFLISEVGHKPYPCCRYCHASIDAAIALHRPGKGPEDIESVHILAGELCVEQTGNRTPTNLLQRQFSTPYGVALGLVNGEASINDYELGNDRAAQLAARCNIRAAEQLPRTSRAAEVSVQWTDGVHRSLRVDMPSGEPACPLSDDTLTAKFQDLARTTVKENAIGVYRRLADLASEPRLDNLLHTFTPPIKSEPTPKDVSMAAGSERSKLAAD